MESLKKVSTMFVKKNIHSFETSAISDEKRFYRRVCSSKKCNNDKDFALLMIAAADEKILRILTNDYKL